MLIETNVIFSILMLPVVGLVSAYLLAMVTPSVLKLISAEPSNSH